LCVQVIGCLTIWGVKVMRIGKTGTPQAWLQMRLGGGPEDSAHLLEDTR
jgi:hypothetical protein